MSSPAATSDHVRLASTADLSSSAQPVDVHLNRANRFTILRPYAQGGLGPGAGFRGIVQMTFDPKQGAIRSQEEFKKLVSEMIEAEKRRSP
jgi:hypothetical protein